MDAASSLSSALILDSDTNIFTVSSDGNTRTYLTDDGPGYLNTGASWSADGTRIVWEHQAPGEKAAIWTMNADGTGKRQLTFGKISASFPVFSPDGTKILFTGVATGGSPEVYEMNADGSDPHALTQTTVGELTRNGGTAQWSLAASFSPDGSKIVYASTQSGHSEIWVMNADGSDQTQLTFPDDPNAPDANAPAWSPDGRKIAFWSGFATESGNVYTINSDGSGRAQLTFDPAPVNNDSPSWWPDGKSIIFQTTKDITSDSAALEIFAINADGSGLQQLPGYFSGSGPQPYTGTAAKVVHRISGQKVIQGAGDLIAFDLGKNDTITGSTAGTTLLDDTYGGGGGSDLIGGCGQATLPGGENSEILAASTDSVTIGNALSYVDASRGSITIQGGNSTVIGTVEGADGYDTNILAGSADVINLGSASSYVDALYASGTRITGAAGFTHVDAGAGTTVRGASGGLDVAAAGGAALVAGGVGNLFVFDIGKGETITGATSGTTFIDDGYGSGGNSQIAGGDGTVTGAGGRPVNTFIVGEAGDTIDGAGGSTFVDGSRGLQSIVGGLGPMTVQAGRADTIAGGSGTLQVYLDSDEKNVTVDLGSGAAGLRDVLVDGGGGSQISVTGFATSTDTIQSATSIRDGEFRGSSASDGNGGTILTFLDGTTMTLAGVSDPHRIVFAA